MNRSRLRGREARDAGAQLPPRRVVFTALALIAAHVFLLISNARTMGGTTDETVYLNAGRIILRHGWVHESTLRQGPLPLYANQLFVGEFPGGGYRGGHEQKELLWRGRLGTLPFAVLAAVLVFLWARSAFGDSGGLLALLFHVANPLIIGYGALVLVDLHHAALVLLVLFVLWRYLETRSLRVLPWLGVALGLALATKYLALLLVLPVAATTALAALLRKRGRGFAQVLAGLGEAVLAVFLVALAALGTLHTCYRFREHSAPVDVTAYESATLRSALEVPVVRAAVRLLPAPFVKGVDYQVGQGDGEWRTFLDGRFASGHRDYYLRTFAYKTPEIVLLAAAAVLVLRLPALLRAGRERRRVTTLLATAPYALVALGFLSFTRMQLGVRYALPLYPLLFVWLGALARPESGTAPRLPGSAFFLALVAIAAAHARDLYTAWPDWISYYNSLSGGQAGAYRHFRDSNSDFGQHNRPASLQVLADRIGPFDVLWRHSGPRFGRLAVDDDVLRMSDAAEPERSRLDWLTVDPPVAHLAASWFVFECSAERLEALVRDHDDLQFRQALACAYLGEDRIADAERHLAHLDADTAAPYRRVLTLLERTREQPDRAALESLARAWLRIGRPDKVIDLARAHPEVADATDVLVGQAMAFEERRDYSAAADVLAERQDELDERAGLLFVRMLLRTFQPNRATAYFETLKRRYEESGATRDSRFLRETGWEIEQLRSQLEFLR